MILLGAMLFLSNLATDTNTSSFDFKGTVYIGEVTRVELENSIQRKAELLLQLTFPSRGGKFSSALCQQVTDLILDHIWTSFTLLLPHESLLPMWFWSFKYKCYACHAVYKAICDTMGLCTWLGNFQQ